MATSVAPQKGLIPWALRLGRGESLPRRASLACVDLSLNIRFRVHDQLVQRVSNMLPGTADNCMGQVQMIAGGDRASSDDIYYAGQGDDSETRWRCKEQQEGRGSKMCLMEQSKQSMTRGRHVTHKALN